MRKIIYPFKNELEKDSFNEEYYNLLKNKIDTNKVDTILKKIDASYSFKMLLTNDFSELLTISTKIKQSKFESNINNFFIKNKKPLKYLYDEWQPLISSFLMDNCMKLNSCHYCNIDFINTIEEHYQFESIKDFILNAPYDVLMLVNLIDKKTAEKIIKYRKYNFYRLIGWPDLINKPIFNYLFNIFNTKKINGVKSVDFRNITIKKNHFTFDHVLPKNKFNFLSLSIFNLVPCCYSCNSKFKHQKEFTVNKELEKFCPTSEKFNADELIFFKMNFDFSDINFEEKIRALKEIKDITVTIENKSLSPGVEEFIKIFKLEARYDFHKYISHEMIEKRRSYSDSQIKELSDFFKNKGLIKSEDNIKREIFGKELFEQTNAPFEKYKKDIAQQLGLIK